MNRDQAPDVDRNRPEIAVRTRFLDLFMVDGAPATVHGDTLSFAGHSVPVRNGIPRFTPDVSYSTDNFSKLRERHATLQLDSRNGTRDRRDTVLSRTRWPTEFFRGKTVLECGCGAGPDTEILLGLGARVLAVDLAGVDIARANVGDNPNVQFVQASIMDLPLKRKSFDIVFCHRVLQHTPSPEATLKHILEFVRDDGAVFVHSYGAGQPQLYRWKYALRHVTVRMNPRLLYAVIRLYARPAYHLTNMLNRTERGRRLAMTYIPFWNHRLKKAFHGKPDAFFIEYGIHDTFDALSPAYDRPIDPAVMERIAAERLCRPFEVDRQPSITLLRTILAPST